MSDEREVARLRVEGGWIHVRTPYNRDFVDDLKDEINRSFRKWNADEKLWSVDIGEMDKIVEICERYFTVEVVDVEQPQQQQGNADNSVYHDFIAELPDDVLRKIFRVIQASMHPDQNDGDDKAFKKSAVHWSEIQRLRKGMQ